MPLYEYQCRSCEHRFEKIQKFSDDLLRTCPKCGKDTLEQLISAPAVQFKGSGWYVTDYAKKNSSHGSSAPASSSADSSSSSASSSESKAESTPAPTKTESKSTPAAPKA